MPREKRDDNGNAREAALSRLRKRVQKLGYQMPNWRTEAAVFKGWSTQDLNMCTRPQERTMLEIQALLGYKFKPIATPSPPATPAFSPPRRISLSDVLPTSFLPTSFLPTKAEPTEQTEAEPTEQTEAEPTEQTEAEPTEPTDESETEAEPTDSESETETEANHFVYKSAPTPDLASKLRRIEAMRPQGHFMYGTSALRVKTEAMEFVLSNPDSDLKEPGSNGFERPYVRTYANKRKQKETKGNAQRKHVILPDTWEGEYYSQRTRFFKAEPTEPTEPTDDSEETGGL